MVWARRIKLHTYIKWSGCFESKSKSNKKKNKYKDPSDIFRLSRIIYNELTRDWREMTIYELSTQALNKTSEFIQSMNWVAPNHHHHHHHHHRNESVVESQKLNRNFKHIPGHAFKFFGIRSMLIRTTIKTQRKYNRSTKDHFEWSEEKEQDRKMWSKTTK